MADNRIDATVTSADVQAALQAVATVKDKFPFLIDLSIAERKSLPKLGDNSRAFVQRALEVAEQNPGILPRNFDPADMRRDLELFLTLAPVASAAARLSELLDDTLTQVGSEAMVSALLVYRLVQGTDGLDAEESDLKQRFARRN